MKACHFFPVYIPSICPQVLALFFITPHETLIGVDEIDLLPGGGEVEKRKGCCYATFAFSRTYLTEQPALIFELDRENHCSGQLIVVDRKLDLFEGLLYQLATLDHFVLFMVCDVIEIKDLLVCMVKRGRVFELFFNLLLFLHLTPLFEG
jgi:hypothetical protein